MSLDQFSQHIYTMRLRCAFAAMTQHFLEGLFEVVSQRSKTIASPCASLSSNSWTGLLSCSLLGATLCLQLTAHAVRISSQKYNAQSDRVLPIVSLARGDVQAKTSEHLAGFLDNLCSAACLDVSLALKGLLTTDAHILIQSSNTTTILTDCGC